VAKGGPERRSFFGRRKGRRLRPSRARLLDVGLGAVRAPIEPGQPADPAHWFNPPVQGVWLEIGFGSGEHLAAQAKANTTIGMLGAEVFVNGIASLLARLEGEGLGNVRIHPDVAQGLLDHLAPATIDRVFVLFPDPWPKRRHAQRRLLSKETIDKLASLMRPGAELRFASDDPVMIAWGLRQLCDHGAFAWLAERAQDWRERPQDWPATRYEAKALREGRLPCYFRFRRV
jgi:tRNA (guanine-N7-)-methyltransferase